MSEASNLDGDSTPMLEDIANAYAQLSEQGRAALAAHARDLLEQQEGGRQ